MTFDQAKLQQLDATGTFRVYGHPLDIGGNESEESESGVKRWLPIHPCHCVQDTPSNPCECSKLPIWWIPIREILRHGQSSRKDSEGKELHFYDVRLDSHVLVESVRPIRAGVLKGLSEAICSGKFSGVSGTTGGTGHPGTMASLWSELGKILLGILVEKVYDEFKGNWVDDFLNWERSGKPFGLPL